LSVQTVARRYASALADVVIKNNETKEVQQELAEWAEMIQSSENLAEVLRSPTIPYKQKNNLLESLIEKSKVSHTTANFLRVLLKNQRISELNEIVKRFAQELDERSGYVAAHIATARPVSQEQQATLETKLMQVTGKKVRLNFETNDELIGGVVTRIGSTVFDGSVRNQLDQLKEQLIGKA
jgi:F-type H+-transporting ATPase subunit delta